MTESTEIKAFTVGGLIGRKIGMMQWFDEDGDAVGVTLLRVGPCVVTQVRTVERDGYQAVQLGLIEPVKVKHLTRPIIGHLKKSGAPYVRKMVEFPLFGEVEPGQQFTVSDLFSVGDLVDVVGWSKGRGFQGAVKRHGFGGGPSSHGSKVHRKPGSIGAATFPGRVVKGKRMPGRMGPKKVKVRNLRIALIEPEEHVIGVVGGVPGAPKSYVLVYRAKSTLMEMMEERAAVLG